MYVKRVAETSLGRCLSVALVVFSVGSPCQPVGGWSGVVRGGEVSKQNPSQVCVVIFCSHPGSPGSSLLAVNCEVAPACPLSSFKGNSLRAAVLPPVCGCGVGVPPCPVSLPSPEWLADVRAGFSQTQSSLFPSPDLPPTFRW